MNFGWGQYVVRRLLTLIPVWVAVTLLTFVVIHAIPGGPFDTGRITSAQALYNLNALYHLDKPLPEQYLLYMKGVVHGDLGVSMTQRGLTVSNIITQRFPTSAILGGCGLLVAVLIGIPGGLLAAATRLRWLDRLLVFFASLGFAIPNFVLSILLLLVVGLWLRWLPVGGWGGVSNVVLPALALGLPWSGLIARMTRASTKESLREDYIRTAVAKGLGPVRVLTRHAFRNAMLPLTTIIALITTEMITGSLVVENIFGIPGVGHYLTDAVLGFDYTMTLGLIVFYSGLVVVANLLVDISYAFLDPRIRVG